MPVSSRTSRSAASRAVSPGSTCPFGRPSTREPSGARRVGTITTTCSSSSARSPRTTTPPAEISCAWAPPRRLEDILLERLQIVHAEPPPALGDHAGALEHCKEAAGRLARGARELREVVLSGRDEHVAARELLLRRGLGSPRAGCLVGGNPPRAASLGPSSLRGNRLLALLGQLLRDEAAQHDRHATLHGLEGLARQPFVGLAQAARERHHQA